MLIQLFLIVSSLLFLLLLSEFSKLSIDKSTVPVITPVANITSYLWPYPTEIQCSDYAYLVQNNKVTFQLMDSNQFPNARPILSDAFNEYYSIIFNLTKRIPNASNEQYNYIVAVSDTQLNITLTSDDVSLTFDTLENYHLLVNYPVSSLTADSVYGALRGLETFSQLILEYENGQLFLHQCNITDAPFFRHRGILYDTSRHYLPVSVLKQHLEVMAWNKFNVFHWHIVDIQSFPYVSDAFPELSAKGAYSPRHTYNKSQVQEVISHANKRGIRVMVEFDTPGHTGSWGKGQPGILTTCYSNGKPDGNYGPINAISNVTWPFLETLFKEIVGEFKDQYIHLGGDEVSFFCWKSNPEIQQWMEEGNYTDYARFEEYYIGKLLNLMQQLGKSYVVWQEVFDNGNKLKEDTIIHVWKGIDNWEGEMKSVTEAGFHALLSSCWYLDRISSSPDYIKYFRCNPIDFSGTTEQQRLVLGGEAAIWGEWVDATNSLSRTWPRASAAGERLWTGASTVGISNSELYDRLHKHRCRLLNRNVPAEPLQPGYCTYPWVPPQPKL